MQIIDYKSKYLEDLCFLEKTCFCDYWKHDMIFEETESPFNVIKLALDDSKEVIGYIIVKRVFEEAEILRLCVLPQNRREGIAEKLLKSAINECLKKDVVRFFLEVRISNIAASSLYKKAGFQLLDIRKKYYSNNEDAAVYFLDAKTV